MAHVTKEQVVDILEGIARLLELKDENVFKVRAYTNAARALETWSGDLSKVVAEGRLGEIAGIGKAIADKITELVSTGELPYYQTLLAEFPPGIFELFQLQGLGPKKIKTLWEKLGVTTLAELELACRDGRISELQGFGKKTCVNLLASIESRSKYAGRFRLGDIAADAERMLADCASTRT
jgi:DNA polymerase (family 10)